MRRIATALLIISPAFGSTAAYAQKPICHERSVVAEISREIRLRSYYSAPIEPELVAEYPTANPSIVFCRICAILTPYDFRIGDNPLGRCVPQTFEIRVVTNGFIVSDRH